MAVITADYIENLEYDGYFGLLDNEHDITQPSGSTRAVESGSTFEDAGLATYTADVSVPAQRDLTADFFEGYFGDYYNRIIITPSSLDLKTLTEEITEEIYIWNSYLASTKTVTVIDEEGTTGLTLSGLTLPVTFQPNEEKEYSIQATLVGPAIIDAEYEFDFGTDLPILTVEGQRLTVWGFIVPLVNAKETLEFETDILKTYSAEQRIALRRGPRQFFDYTFNLTANQFSQAKGVFLKWASNQFGIPVWGEYLSFGAISSGETTLTFDTTKGEFYEDGYIFMYDLTDATYQSIQLTGVTDTGVTLKNVTHAFTNALVMPMKKGYATQGIQFDRKGADDNTVAKIVFTVINDNYSLTASGSGLGYDTYLTEDVITDKTVLISSISESIKNVIDIFDNKTGNIVLQDKYNYSHNRKMISFYANDMQRKWNLKTWLYGKLGKQKRFWTISWNKDIVPVQDILTSQQSIVCENIQYTLFRTITHIALIKTDGSILYNKITVGSEVGDNENLALDVAFPTDITISEVDRICFMSKVRLDTDKIDINYSAGRLPVEISLPVVEVPE